MDKSFSYERKYFAMGRKKDIHEGGREHDPSVERYAAEKILLAFNRARVTVVGGVAVVSMDRSDHRVRGRLLSGHDEIIRGFPRLLLCSEIRCRTVRWRRRMRQVAKRVK